MKKIVKYEWIKCLHQPILFGIVGILFFVNGILVYNHLSESRRNGYSSKEIAAVYEELEGKTEDEMLSALEGKLETFLEEKNYINYGKYRHVYEQVQTVLHYPQYLENVIGDGNSIANSGIFEEKSSFTYKNNQKVKKCYSRLEGRVIEAGVSDGFLSITDYRVTEVFILIGCMLFILKMLTMEWESDYFSLIKSMKYGGVTLILSKAIVAVGITTGLTFLFYGSNVIIAANVVGLGDWDRAIQSLDGYEASPFLITVGQYLAAFFITKLIGIFVFCSIIFCAAVIFPDLIGVIFVLAAILGIQFMIWYRIDIHSWLSLLHYINLFAVLDTSSFFSDYINFNLLGVPVNQIVVDGIMSFLLIVGGIGIGCYCFARNISFQMEPVYRYFTRMKKKKWSFHVNLLRHEMYKFLIINRGLFLILLLIMLCFYGSKEFFYIDSQTYYYEAYSKYLKGELNSENEKNLKEEEKRLEQLEEDFMNGKNNNRDIQYQMAGFLQAKEQYEQLKERQAEGYSVSYFSQTGWEMLLGSYGRRMDVIFTGIMGSILILAFSQQFFIEKRTSMNQIQNSIYRGNRRSAGRKYLLAVFYAIAAVIAAFLPITVRILLYYEPSGFRELGGSILVLEESVWNTSIYKILWTVWCYRITGAVLASFLILLCSEYQSFTTVILSIAAVIIPVITYLLNLTKEWGFLYLMTGHRAYEKNGLWIIGVEIIVISVLWVRRIKKEIDI